MLLRFSEESPLSFPARILLPAALMTAPRFIRPGRTWLITRRTTRRHFLLRPDADGTVQRIYWYTTAVFAKKFGIEVHAVQMLSTHLHEVLTDRLGKLPDFIRERNRAFANALKCHRRWPEEVFQRAPASYVELYGPAAILKEIGYTLANCVEAGLVRDPRRWPGVTVDVEDIGRRTIVAARPPIYFDPNNPIWPKEASLELAMPSLLSIVYGSRAREVLLRAVESAISTAKDSARKAGYVVGSIANLLRVPFTKRSRSSESERRGSPRFATAGDPTLTKLAKFEEKQFLEKYEQALVRLGSIIRWVEFPEGSWRWARELARIFGTHLVASNDVVAIAG